MESLTLIIHMLSFVTKHMLFFEINFISVNIYKLTFNFRLFYNDYIQAAISTANLAV